MFSRFTTVALLIVVVFMAVSVYERFLVERETLHKTQAMDAQLGELVQHKQVLSKKVKRLAGGRGMEEEIRRNFDVVKPGEQVVILSGPTSTATTSRATTTAPPSKKPWYQFW